MSTAQLTGARAGVSGESDGSIGVHARSALGASVAIAVGLLLVILYAAFDHGAVGLAVDTRIEIAIAALAAVAGAAWLWSGRIRFSAPPIALAGVALLAAFACWSGITVIWSVAADQTWIELNRAIAYVIVVCLAIAVGASYRRAIELVAIGFLLVALAVTAYALGQKLVPGLHIAGVLNLNQTAQLARLQEPLGYWNALALFLAFAVPIALALAVDRARTRPIRIAAACAAELMLLTIGLTYSRGGLLALVVAIVVAAWFGGELLRSLIWAGAAILAAIPPLAFGLASHSLTTANVPLSSRESAGGQLALIMLLSLAALVLACRALIALDPRLTLGHDATRALRRVAAAGGVVIVLAVLLALALSARGLPGSISHAWDSFTATQTASNTNPSRLLSADSENRWVWWKEAAAAFSDRPIGGWGAGSFPVLHLMYRHNTLPVQQPHNVPLQFLAETGIVGALLAIAAYVLLLRAAASSARNRPRGTRRLLAAALLGAIAAYGIHCLYDWDWNIPAVTLPALVFIGVLAGAASGPRHAGSFGAVGAPARLLSTALLSLWLCAFVLSAAFPSLAASDANSALVQAASGAPGALRSAEASARSASTLDPLSDAGPRAQATVALHRGQVARARAYLSEAVGRDPSDGQAWEELAFVYSLLGEDRDARIAAQRVVALDPRGPEAQALIRSHEASPVAAR